jgi:hypothetical protein
MALQTMVVIRKLVHIIISCTKTMFLYALVPMTIIDLVALSCILRHSGVFQGTRLQYKELNLDSDRLSIEVPYELANRQHTLTTWIEGYTKISSDTKVTINSFCIVFSKAATFTYEIRHLDPLTQTFFIIKYITTNNIFPIHYTKNVANYSTISAVFYIGSRFQFIHS